jgi:hypothetical protein
VVGCLSDEDVLAFIDGEVRSEGHAHLAGCEDCRAVVAEAARGLYEPDGAAATNDAETLQDHGRRHGRPLAPGDRVGRYQVRRPIGAGGAGVVYEAFDPQLGRKIALKMLRPDGARWLTRGPRRLLREARAMARLSHPNVVNVYDAGAIAWEGEVFIALEYVDGRTMAHWIRDDRPGWREVVRLFLDAGQGLAAAHRAHLVHGDFKPENVLIGSDGRARVSDFGLARSNADRSPPAPPEPAREPAGALLTLTEAGALVGTPAYMAPEQFEGARPDERTDQFNFCAALYRALYHSRPFGGQDTEPSVESLGQAVLAGELHDPPADGVPAALFAVVRRGLSRAPAERWSSMDDLLAALERTLGGRSTPRRGWWLAATGLLLGLVAVMAVPRRHPPALSPAPEAAPVVEVEPFAVPPDRDLPASAPVIPVHRARPRPAPAPRPVIAAPENSERYGHRLKDPFAGR